ncbi:hypothetical protein HPP92_010839 [Vanilla planifolia]|uniref:Uncharacterized protein n=1 Tax=Vanilla planifolia TaxID=51239 RepID=A0A835V3V9_VANPL|nr:hypothetical protein HPP92_010839 [Vanilla planifolia]
MISSFGQPTLKSDKKFDLFWFLLAEVMENLSVVPVSTRNSISAFYRLEFEV